jgi:hypothetical protein
VIEKTYKWMVLSSDGLLKEPETRGPYYSEDSLNNYSGFESEKEANDRLIEWDKDNRFSESYVLITECRVKK